MSRSPVLPESKFVEISRVVDVALPDTGAVEKLEVKKTIELIDLSAEKKRRIRRGSKRGMERVKEENNRPIDESDDAEDDAEDDADEDDDEEEEEKVVPKKKKSEKKAVQEEPFVDLGGRKRATVSEFKGHTLVHIRQYYENSSGEMRPSKIGIALKISEFEVLKKSIGKIDKMIDVEGE